MSRESVVEAEVREIRRKTRRKYSAEEKIRRSKNLRSFHQRTQPPLSQGMFYLWSFPIMLMVSAQFPTKIFFSLLKMDDGILPKPKGNYILFRGMI